MPHGRCQTKFFPLLSEALNWSCLLTSWVPWVERVYQNRDVLNSLPQNTNTSNQMLQTVSGKVMTMICLGPF